MNLQEFEGIANSWKKLSVLVVGDIMIDRHIYCHPHKLSQEAPVQVLMQDRTVCAPGGAAGVAMMCAAMGATVSLFGRVDNGDEPTDETEELLFELDNAGVDIEGLVQDSQSETPIKTRIWAALDQHYQQVLRIDDELPTISRTPIGELLADCRRCATYETADIVIISDYNKGFCTQEMFAVLPKQGEEKGCRYVDPPDRSNWITNYTAMACHPNYVVTNLKKAFGISSAGLAERLNAHVVTTKGSAGCDWSTMTGRTGNVPTRQRYPIDVTGCGDQFMAVFAMTQFNYGMQKACEVANRAAGLQAMRIGCRPVHATEIMVELIEEGRE